MRVKLTDRNVKTSAPATGTIELWDTACPGLALRIHAGGKRSYCVTTRLAPDGRQIRRTIGTTDSHGLAAARDAAREIIRNAAKGLDSAGKEEKKRAARQAKADRERATANTFRSIVKGYLADTGRHGGANNRSKKLVEQRLENHTMQLFGDRPIADITRGEVKDLIRSMADAGNPIAANRLLGNLKLIWKWAVEADKIPSSPISDLDKPADEHSRDRVLTNDELRDVWQGCGELSKAHAGAIRLMVLTGARRSEAGGLLRSEIVGDEWHLPADRSKNGLPHIWFLTEQAGTVVASVPQVEDGDPVFSLDGEKSINGWSKIKARLDGILTTARAKAAGEKPDPKKHALPRWTFHDLRRTMVTRMNEDLAVPPHIVEAVVNHVSGAKAGVAGTYNRAVYMPQRREALVKWSEYVAAIVAGKPTAGIVYIEPASNVVPLEIRAAS